MEEGFMKKDRSIIVRVMIIATLVFVQSILSSCASNKKEETKANTENFDMKAASNVADTYMKYLMKEDIENSKRFYSKELLKNVTGEEDKSLKILGYDLSETSEVGKSGLFKMKVSRSDVSKPFASLDEYSLKIKKEASDYKISETNDVVQKEAFMEGNQIRLRNKNSVSTNLVVDMDGIPNYTFSKDDKANINKIIVPKGNFGIINFSYTGDNLAISTYNKDSYIGLIKIDEALAVQSNSGGGDSENKGGGSSSQNQGGGGSTKEKPIGKEITSIDLLKDSKIEFVNFSPTEKFITVQYSKPVLGRCIRVYKSDGGDMIPFKFEEKYPMNKVDVVFSSYDKETLNFDVISKVANDKSVSDIVGKWQISLKDFKQKKI
jgi:hypothetical protein